MAQKFGYDIFRATEGVCHFDELFLMFQNGILPLETAFSEEDEIISDHLWTLWTNFAKTGDPTPGGATVGGAKWERWDDCGETEP